MARRTADRNHGLTRREIEVIQWLAFGKSAGEIAVILSISATTVRAHTRRTLQKLSACNIPHAVAIAFRSGILQLESAPSRAPS